MKGIEFLKKIGRIEEGMISEAANPIKKNRKWNGNMIKFVGLAACIAVFVGAICVGRAGLYLKKNKAAMSSTELDSTEEISMNLSESSASEKIQEESVANQNEAVSKRMVMLEGKIYVDVGESDIEGRCGIMDGSINSSVENGEYPKTDYQSNFGSGYGYQHVAENSIDVNIDGQWIRFESFVSGEQEEPFEQPYTEGPFDEKEPVTEEYTEPVETVRPARFEVSLNVDSITSEGAEFVIINIGYEYASTGMDFRIEKLVDGNWKECDYVNGEPAWQESALLLESEKETTFYADWSKIYGSLEKGTYRFRKSVYGDDGGQEIYCQFTL